MRSKQAPSRLPLKIVRELLGPGRTIAKENRERKEKSQKKAGKLGFFEEDVEIPAKTAVRTRFREPVGR